MCLRCLNLVPGIRGESADYIGAAVEGCNKAGYRAVTYRQCQNIGSLAKRDAFIQRHPASHIFCTVMGTIILDELAIDGVAFFVLSAGMLIGGYAVYVLIVELFSLFFAKKKK